MKMIINSVIDDKSRCRLSTIPGEAGSDYINASHIKVSQISFTYLIGCVQYLCII